MNKIISLPILVFFGLCLLGIDGVNASSPSSSSLSPTYSREKNYNAKPLDHDPRRHQTSASISTEILTEVTTKPTMTSTTYSTESPELVSTEIPTNSMGSSPESVSAEIPTNSMGSSPESLKLSPRIVSLNIMVAGLAGMGKTTCCRALLDSWWQEVKEGEDFGEIKSVGVRKKRTTTTRRRFLSSTVTTNTTSNKRKSTPSTVSTTDISPSAPFEYYDEEANTILRVKIIDTPGFGNKVNHRNSVKPITNYISCCRHRRFRREESPITVVPTLDDCYLGEENYSQNSNDNKNTDNNYSSMLVHVCLYFISPGRFLAIDRHFLRHVQDEITIVPIIAKADTMTDDEIARFRAELTKIWQEESIDVYSLDNDHISSKNRSRNKKMMNEDTTSKRTLYRGRRPGEVLAVIARNGKYPWGSSYSLDPEHSDLKLIRDSLLSEHTERFLELATEKYYTYRNQQIARKRRFGLVKYAALVFLASVQLRKIDIIRVVLSKVISFIPVDSVSKVLWHRNRHKSSPLVEDNDNIEVVVAESSYVPSRNNDKKLIRFFGMSPFDLFSKQR